jgi:hypothetical protein
MSERYFREVCISEKFVGKAIQSVSVEVAFPNETKKIQLKRLKQTKNRLCETILKFQKIRFFCPSTVLNPNRLTQKSDALPTDPDGSGITVEGGFIYPNRAKCLLVNYDGKGNIPYHKSAVTRSGI